MSWTSVYYASSMWVKEKKDGEFFHQWFAPTQDGSVHSHRITTATGSVVFERIVSGNRPPYEY